MLRGVTVAGLAVMACAAGVSGALAHGNAVRGDDVVLRGGVPAGPAAPSRPSLSWCGSTASATDRRPDLDVSSQNEVHVVYAVPADGTDRFSDYASRIASDAAAIDTWWQGQDPTRTPRFDLYPFPGCTTKYGDLDISSVRLPQAGSAYGPQSGSSLIFDLADFDSLDAKKILVYYDGPVPDDQKQICGTAYVNPQSQDSGGVNGFVFVWLQSGCPDDVGAGAFSAAVATHETLHTLGAVPTGAPNVCPSSPGHVCDSTSDVLYPFATPSTSLATVTLDVGRNDYYGHSGAWFDVQDSPWLTHLPQLQLTVGLAGSPGRVDVVAPGAASCTQSCSFQVDSSVQVTLRATPAAGARLVGWSGACSGTGGCVVTMDAAQSVTATFAAGRPPPKEHLLTVSIRGKGAITSSPAGISCPGRCSAGFAAATVRLAEKPAKGYRFTGWIGSCHGPTRSCTLKLDRDKAARATFKKV